MTKIKGILMNAEKAFLVSSTTEERLKNVELEKIAQEINNAIAKGYYGIFYEVRYPKNIILLKNMGYQITDINVNTVRISWWNGEKETK